MPFSGARRLNLALVAALALASIACFAYPLYVIWPFRYQGPRELAAALFVLRIGPWASVVCALVCAGLAAYAWPQTRGWMRRGVLLACAALAVAGAWLARFNLYEQLMFHPIRNVQAQAGGSAHVDADDMVLAVKVDQASRAYPIREIAYHHVVNDTLAGEPIVATY
ncbi:MAG: DUF3179 domain-containing protein [Acidobacteriaceae bacterium]|nr:DUF3179 domain-containing protein [Acidobacteriaceae bacterium]